VFGPIPLGTACQIVFQRVHIRRQSCNRAEDKYKVEVEADADQMKATTCHRDEPCREQDFISCFIVLEE